MRYRACCLVYRQQSHVPRLDNHAGVRAATGRKRHSAELSPSLSQYGSNGGDSEQPSSANLDTQESAAKVESKCKRRSLGNETPPSADECSSQSNLSSSSVRRALLRIDEDNRWVPRAGQGVVL
jgi:hypothetical protein